MDNDPFDLETVPHNEAFEPAPRPVIFGKAFALRGLLLLERSDRVFDVLGAFIVSVIASRISPLVSMVMAARASPSHPKRTRLGPRRWPICQNTMTRHAGLLKFLPSGQWKLAGVRMLLSRAVVRA